MNATSSASPGPGQTWRCGLLIFLAVLALSAPQAALLPLLDRDEPHFAEASREMLQSGNFIVPTFNHEPRYNKPPLIYWCQALSFTLFGENAFAARLPSVLATAATAWLLFGWGVRFVNKDAGLIAALAYAFCLQTAQQGRVATADALLIFFMTLTALTGWRLLELTRCTREQKETAPSQQGNWNFWGTLLALGFAGGFLAKGPEALLPIIPLLIGARSCGKPVLASFVAILLLGLFIASWWGIPALIETHGDYWHQGMSEGVFTRATNPLQGHGASTFGWYLLGVPLYYPLWAVFGALPLWPLLVTHRKRLFGAWNPDPMDTYLLLNAGIIVLVFSLMATKLPHYTLPAFPFLALLLARRWISAGLSPRLPALLAGGVGIMLALIAAVRIPVALAHHFNPSPTGELVRAAQADQTLTPGTEFALVDFKEPNAIWEMRRISESYGQLIPESEVIAFLGRPGPHAVVLSAEVWQLLAEKADPTWKTYGTRGWSTAKVWDAQKGDFAFIDLTLVVKP